MSNGASDIQALRRAIIGEAQKEARQQLVDAKTKAKIMREQAEAQVEEQRADVLARARKEAESVESNAVAQAQLEAQMLKLKRREQLLQQVFDAARENFLTIPQRDDYPQVVRRLVREAASRLGVRTLVVHADPKTLEVLDDAVLVELGKELDVDLELGEPLARGIGVVLETADAHRRYDNTLSARLARMEDTLRGRLYHVLMGDTAL
jgi:V/A-type H+-transporting ATPase subunit E